MKQTPSRRRAVILMLVLGLFLVMSLFIAGLSTQLARSHGTMRNRWQQEQAWWLAQSQLDRFVLQNKSQPLASQSRTMVMGGREYRVDTLRTEATDGSITLSATVFDPNVEPPRAIITRSVQFAAATASDPSNNEN